MNLSTLTPILLSLFVSFQVQAKTDADSVVLNELSSLNQANTSGYVEGISVSDVEQIRYKAMTEAAQVLGLQEGVKFRQEQINGDLKSISDQLDKIYNFKQLLLNDGLMVPPVIDEVHGAKKIEADGSINTSERTYIIRKNAKLTIDPPAWRSYLIHDFGVTDRINKAVLPKNDEEQAVWKSVVKQSWQKGIEQANHMFTINLNRLNRDYLGMVRFKSLSKQKMVDIPMLASGDLGIRVNGKKLDIGQKTFRITNHSTFQKDGWQALGSTGIE